MSGPGGGQPEAAAAAAAAPPGLRVLEATAEALVRYAGGLNDAAAPISPQLTPQEIAAAFEVEGCALPLTPGDAPLSDARVLAACRAVLAMSVRTSHPLFLNQLYGQPDLVGVAAEWLASLLNTNVHTFEVAPVFSMLEQAAVARVCALVWPHREPSECDGLFTPGGSLANTYGLLLARQRALPTVKEKGMAAALAARGCTALHMYVADNAHYSYKKAAAVVGIGTDNVVRVRELADGALDAAHLEHCVRESADAGALPFFVGATLGSTVRGAFDRLPEVAAVCERHGMWLHGDGAWGGAALLSRDEATLALMGGHALLDSYAWNPHKIMGLPLQCSLFVTRHGGALAHANSAHAAYLFQPDKLHAEYDIGDKTIMCGRKADACKLWLTWKAIGDGGLAARVDTACARARQFASLVAERASFRLVFGGAQFANVCFWYLPPPLAEALPTAQRVQELERGDALWQSVHAVAPEVKARMQRDGRVWIGFQPFAGMPNFFRIVFPGAAIIEEGMLAHTLSVIEELGRDVDVGRAQGAGTAQDHR